MVGDVSPGVAAVGDFFHGVAFEVGAGEEGFELGGVFEVVGLIFSSLTVINYVVCYDGNTEMHGFDQ